ncbi:hypothetical protein [Streptomyces sp. 1222.5]|uniref:hypothetical protein n=1 Tax=Streptomyces sp. 1222.5 TaxID=1881026 RepID=UPI003D708F75
MDLDAVADELYALAPSVFTAARDESAQAARAAGDRKLAEEIRRLRRPTLSAWASNLPGRVGAGQHRDPEPGAYRRPGRLTPTVPCDGALW